MYLVLIVFMTFDLQPENQNHLSNACLQVLKVWDADDQYCVQTLPLSFPSFDVLGKVVEFGIRSLYQGPSSGTTPTPSGSGETAEADVWQRDQLLVACCDCVAVLRVRAARDRATPPPLPPPSREHHASVPSPWTAADARGIVTPDLPLSIEQSDCRYCQLFVRASVFPSCNFVVSVRLEQLGSYWTDFT